MNQKKHSTVIAPNKKARHLYELCNFLEAGISLTGPEVKSLRQGKVNFMDSYIDFKNREAFVIGMHIAPYDNAGYVIQNPTRERKLLLHKREIDILSAKVEQKGLTIVPVKLYFHQGKIKLEIAVGRGKKLYDHRESLKRRAEERDMERTLSGRD